MKREHLISLRVLWGALFASTLFYLYVIFMLAQNESDGSEAESLSMVMPAAFAVVSVSLAGASVLIPRLIAKSQLTRLELGVAEMSLHQLQLREGDRSRYFENPEEARRRALPVLRVAFILGMALAESIALFGFVLLFLGYDLAIGIPFFVVCWGLMASHFPRADKLDEQIEDAYDADLNSPTASRAGT